jgi:hypothetical protein
MECSVGQCVQEDCHKKTYQKVSRRLTKVFELSEADEELLQLRIGTKEIQTVCTYHEKKFLVKYHHLFGQVCCDPLQYHKSRKKKAVWKLHVII